MPKVEREPEGREIMVPERVIVYRDRVFQAMKYVDGVWDSNISSFMKFFLILDVIRSINDEDL